VISVTRAELDWDALQGRRVVLVPASEGDEPIDPPAGMAWRSDEPMYVLEPAELAADEDTNAGGAPR